MVAYLTFNLSFFLYKFVSQNKGVMMLFLIVIYQRKNRKRKHVGRHMIVCLGNCLINGHWKHGHWTFNILAPPHRLV